MTSQRQVIIEELSKVRTHPTADEVYQLVRRRLPRISLGTVYRNLEVHSQCSMIQKLELGGSQRRFDGTMSRHYHVRCQQCGKLEDISTNGFNVLDDAVRGGTDFEITGYRLEYIGLCPQCKPKAKSPLQ